MLICGGDDSYFREGTLAAGWRKTGRINTGDCPSIIGVK